MKRSTEKQLLAHSDLANLVLADCMLGLRELGWLFACWGSSVVLMILRGHLYFLSDRAFLQSLA